MKTRNAVKILQMRAAKNPALQRAYEKAKIGYNIAQLIREAREAAGLTQTQLAKLVRTKQSVISRLEDADYEGHSLRMLQKISKALGKEIVIEMRDPV